MRYCYFILAIIILGCNPIPKKDAHPDVALLTDLLKDNSKFKKIIDMKDVSELIFLNDDRILIKPNNSNKPFKITDENGKVVFEEKYDWKLPFYVAKNGDLYFNKKKFFHPDYKRQEEFKTVVFADSLSKKAEELKDLNDSVALKELKNYEIALLKPYGLKPCPYTIVNTANCNVFKIINETLVVRDKELFHSELSVPKFAIDKFDDDVLIKWQNGRLPNPVYLAYYKLNEQKFKCDDMTLPTTVTLNSKTYLYAPSLGLYQVLF
mgnify:CR=1 FL=1